MDKRFAIFCALAFLLIIVNSTLQMLFFPRPAAVAQRDGDKAKTGDKAKDKSKAQEHDKLKDADGSKGADNAAKLPADKAGAPDQAAGKEPAKDEKPPAAADKPAAEEPAQPEVVVTPQWVTIGSGDATKPYRMLVTLTNLGAAIERVELNSDRYRDTEDRSGYMGYLATADAPKGAGSLVRVVGLGTPAANAGLKPGDVIESIDGRRINSAAALDEALNASQPGQTVSLVLQGGQQASVVLARRPLEIVRPELNSLPLDVVQSGQHDPLSMLLTLEQAGDQMLGEDDEELRGLKLRTDPWEVAASDESQCTFRKKLPALGLELTKRYRLAKVKSEEGELQPAYHLDFEIEVRNIGKQPQEVAYRLDGPTGVVLEGSWYASKISHNWGSAGLRDIDGKFKAEGGFKSGKLDEIGCATIASGDAKAWPTAPLQYVAVDAQYFAAAVIPAESIAEDFMSVKPIRVGAVPKDSGEKKLTDVSFRIVSRAANLKPNDEIKHTFQLFLGPKQPGLLGNYGPPDASLGALVYYGWFGWVAEPMLWLLHGFYGLVHNYGVAIVMLTLLVRGCMFPLSRKQAISAQKMQEVQPQLKQITEKYKKEPEKLRKAQQELYQKYNFNPLGGCWMMFIQLPIFMGLYRSLMVDVELRQAPLINDTMRWCSNLAAPDMLYNWSAFMPDFVTNGTGMLGLGPYLNVFPLVTIGLFIWQQKMFMPPPADEQAAMQQKMMQYMMIFMGIMFFKVASGLCLYFIASSIWGITERKLLHPPQTPPGGVPVKVERPEPGGNGHGGSSKRKERGRK